MIALASKVTGTVKRIKNGKTEEKTGTGYIHSWRLLPDGTTEPENVPRALAGWYWTEYGEISLRSPVIELEHITVDPTQEPVTYIDYYDGSFVYKENLYVCSDGDTKVKITEDKVESVIISESATKFDPSKVKLVAKAESIYYFDVCGKIVGTKLSEGILNGKYLANTKRVPILPEHLEETI